MTSPSAFRASRAIGAVFFSLLGGIWLAIGAYRAFGSVFVPVFITAPTVALFLYAAYVFQQNKAALAGEAETPAKKKTDGIFNAVNAGQWILIFIVGNVLVNVHHPEWVLAAAMFIIGLHFLPLALVFRYPPHYVTGMVLMLWAVGYPFLAPTGPANPAGCLGTGFILWASALYGLLSPLPRNP